MRVIRRKHLLKLSVYAKELWVCGNATNVNPHTPPCGEFQFFSRVALIGYYKITALLNNTRMKIRVSKYNSEGYYSPTEYEGMMNVLREEYEKKQALKKKVFMPKVFICSPFRGDVYKNILNAKRYCRFAVDSGYIPFAPHLFFPRFLDDENERERALGIKMGKVFLDDCRELWYFGDTITEGMQYEIDRAKHRKLTIRHFTVNLEEVKD